MNKLVFFLFLFLGSQISTFGQTDQTTRDKRKQRVIVEKAKQLFQKEDSIFLVRDIPTEYADESVVLIAQKIMFEYGVKGSLDYNGSVRKLIKLQDKAAVKGFESIEFSAAEGEVVGIQIIKPSGQLIVVDMTKAVGVDLETQSSSSTLFKNYERGKFAYKKVALENLEVGDIIDYVSSSEGVFSNFFLPSCTNLMLINFQEAYPILNFDVEFKVRRGFYINAISLKGAPKLQLNEQLSDNRFQIFTASAKNSKPYKTTDWTFVDVVLPILKFQICLSSKKGQGDEIVGEIGVVKDQLTPTDIQKSVSIGYTHLLKNHKVTFGGYTYSKYRWPVEPYTKVYVTWINRYHRGVKNDKIIFEKLYYKIRYDFFLGEYEGLGNIVNDEFFATLLHSTMKQLGFVSRLVAAPGRTTTTGEGLLSRREMYWLVVIGTGKTQQIVFPISVNSNPNDNFWRLSGVEGQIIDTDLRRTPENYKAKFLTLPADDASENTVAVVNQIEIDDNLNLKIKSTHKYTGQNRLNAPAYYLATLDLEKEDISMFAGDKEVEKASKRRRDRLEKEGKAFDLEEAKSKQRGQLEKNISNRFKLVEYERFSLKSTGRSSKNPVLEVEQQYVIGEMVTKVGNNYLLDLGKMFGAFEKLDTAEQRDFPIRYDFPMQITYRFVIDVPTGYQAEGLNGFSVDYESTVGVFKVKPTLENEQLTITINRTFAKAEMSKEEWKEFARFMNLAFNFSQKKVLLKKI